jgi:hypothetical protein
MNAVASLITLMFTGVVDAACGNDIIRHRADTRL